MDVFRMTGAQLQRQATDIGALTSTQDANTAASRAQRESNELLAQSHADVATAARDQRAAELALVSPLFAVLDSADQLQAAQQEVNRLRRKGKLDTEAGTDAVRAELEAYVQVQDDLLAYGTALDESGASHRQVTRDVPAFHRERTVPDDV